MIGAVDSLVSQAKHQWDNAQKLSPRTLACPYEPPRTARSREVNMTDRCSKKPRDA